MPDAIGSNSDDLLLLTMRVATDDDSLDKARTKIKQLQNDLKDVSSGFDTSKFINGLNTAVQALRLAVNAWNALETKTIQTATSRDYIQYDLTPGQRQNLLRIDNNKVAKEYNMTSGTVLNSLLSIGEQQAAIRFQGQNPDDKTWSSIYQLANAVGDPRFQRSSLSNMLTVNPSLTVFEGLTDMLYKAYQEMYKTPEHSPERQKWQQLIDNVKKSPYIDDAIANYIAFMANKVDYNPMYPMIQGDARDAGTYGEKLDTKLKRSVNIHEGLSRVKTEFKETGEQFTVGLYNFLGTGFLNDAEYILSLVNTLVPGRSIKGASTTFEGSNIGTRWMYNKVYKEAARTGKFSDLAGLTAVGEGSVLDQEERAKAFLGGYKESVTGESPDAVAGELFLYEAMKLGTSNYANQTIQAFIAAQDKIAAKIRETQRKDNGKKYSIAESNTLALDVLHSDAFADAFTSGGFGGLWSALYKGGYIDSKEYLNFMEEALNNAKHNNLNKFYGEGVDKNKEVTAKVKEDKENGEKVLRIVIEEKENGKLVNTTTMTPDNLADYYARGM